MAWCRDPHFAPYKTLSQWLLSYSDTLWQCRLWSGGRVACLWVKSPLPRQEELLLPLTFCDPGKMQTVVKQLFVHIKFCPSHLCLRCLYVEEEGQGEKRLIVDPLGGVSCSPPAPQTFKESDRILAIRHLQGLSGHCFFQVLRVNCWYCAGWIHVPSSRALNNTESQHVEVLFSVISILITRWRNFGLIRKRLQHLAKNLLFSTFNKMTSDLSSWSCPLNWEQRFFFLAYLLLMTSATGFPVMIYSLFS